MPVRQWPALPLIQWLMAHPTHSNAPVKSTVCSMWSGKEREKVFARSWKYWFKLDFMRPMYFPVVLSQIPKYLFCFDIQSSFLSELTQRLSVLSWPDTRTLCTQKAHWTHTHTHTGWHQSSTRYKINESQRPHSPHGSFYRLKDIIHPLCLAFPVSKVENVACFPYVLPAGYQNVYQGFGTTVENNLLRSVSEKVSVTV